MDLGDGQYLVEGSMKLDDLNDILDLELSSEDYDSCLLYTSRCV